MAPAFVFRCFRHNNCLYTCQDCKSNPSGNGNGAQRTRPSTGSRRGGEVGRWPPECLLWFTHLPEHSQASPDIAPLVRQTGLQSRVPDAAPAPGKASSQPHVLRIRKTEARRLGACLGPTAANTDPNTKAGVCGSHLNTESPATCRTLDKTF